MFSEGQQVQVHINLGPLGMRWSDGYLFHKYEEQGERAIVPFMNDEPTCLVRIVGGFSDGCIVRYCVSKVRALQAEAV